MEKTINESDIRPSRDAGPNFPRAARAPVLKASASTLTLAGDRQPSLEGHPLRDVRNDTKSRAFCGPTTVAAITGALISEVRNGYRLVRHGPSWINMARAPAIMSTHHLETEKVLRLFGFTGSWERVEGSPTMAAFLKARRGAMRTHPCAVFVTGHVVAVSGWQFCDTFSNGEVVEADDAPRRRARVKRVFVITGRIPPATVPRKDYSAAAARAAAGQKARNACTRFLAETGRQARTRPR
ncbi:MAG: hypothetical protein KKD02_05840 [Alphaproteobacteria bacterium]|nr:hypothetical protein [Alphaproteobacteria bacterium]